MSETKHTPGPWHAEGSAAVGFFMVKNEAGERVLNIRGGMIPTVTDARLIAAAPDLLAALCEGTKALEWFQSFANQSKEAHATTTVLIGNARAAIAKAEGRDV